MKTTLELLEKAAAKVAPLSERQLSMRLGHAATTLAMARRRGSLSPVIAGQLAELTGDDVVQWMALASLESEPKSPVTDRLKRMITTTRNS
jgi:hypothetical protein